MLKSNPLSEPVAKIGDEPEPHSYIRYLLAINP